MMEFPSAEAFADLLSGNRKEPVWLPVLSGSMGPLLIPGDEVLILPCSWKCCGTGDIIIFRQGLSLFVHRMIFRGRFFQKVLIFQKGDAMERGGFIPPDSIVGRCARRRRGGKELLLDDKKTNMKLVRKIRKKLIKQTGKGIIKWLLKKATTSP
jgi:hypothetical protein